MFNKTHPTPEELRRAIRAGVCKRCHARPRGSEAIASDLPRPCETDCPLFGLLPRLYQLVYLDPMVSNLREAAKRVLREKDSCRLPTGDNSPPSPQRRYQRRIVQTIEQLNHSRG